MSKRIVSGIVKEGHRVASGMAGDDRFPEGTLALQIPRFAERGLDLSSHYRGTLNVCIAPNVFRIGKAWKTLPAVKWSPVMPAENFSFYRCEIRTSGMQTFEEGLVYWPHPSTKPEFEQDPSVLEILAPFIEEASYGSAVDLLFDPEEIEIPY
jgi:hypothetical protein